MPDKPDRTPRNPLFSCGPCAKRPGWSPSVLGDAVLGRSHRSSPARARLQEVIERSRALIELPDDWRLGIVPGSDTGAVEMAMWSLLGARGVDVLAWESFGKGWVTDITAQLRLDDVRILEADYGALPDLSCVDCDRDVVFTWNGTTSGVRVPDGSWIAEHRAGLTLCDATSAVLAQDIPWSRIDAATFSWQKVLGGEAAHGMLVLSPRAVERLESRTPAWPMPKLFRLVMQGRLNEGIFRGDTINTPSLLCVEDVLDALRWAEGLGGLPALKARADANLAAVDRWVDQSGWARFLARDPATRSNTSICLRIAEESCAHLPEERQTDLPRRMAELLGTEGIAHDINGYRDAPPGLRLWGGATVETADMEAVLPWLDWSFATLADAR